MRWLRVLAILVIPVVIGAAVQAKDSAAPPTPAPPQPALSPLVPAVTVCSAAPAPTLKAGLLDPAAMGETLFGFPAKPLFCQCHSASQCPGCPPPSRRVCIACLCDCS
jgi:hypothetical protein